MRSAPPIPDGFLRHPAHFVALGFGSGLARHAPGTWGTLAALPGSVLVPLDELTERADEIEPPPGALVVAYCHHGVRSLSAAALLDRLGLPGVASLRGGIDAWSREIDPSVPRY